MKPIQTLCLTVLKNRTFPFCFIVKFQMLFLQIIYSRPDAMRFVVKWISKAPITLSSHFYQTFSLNVLVWKGDYADFTLPFSLRSVSDFLKFVGVVLLVWVESI